MATRADLRASLLLRLANRSDVTVAMLDSFLDGGMLDLATRRYSLRALEAGPFTSVVPTASADNYTVPVDSDAQPLFAITHIIQHDSNGATAARGGVQTRRLLPWEGTIETMFDALARRVVSASDGPSRFAVYNNRFFVYPAPGADAAATITWDIYGYRRPFMGPNPADMPNLDPEWHYAIGIVAAIHAFRDLGDEERAQATEGELDRWYQQRDSATRIERRFSRSRGGARPHPNYFNRLTGV